MELFDDLNIIKEQLFDATPEVKTAFNNIVKFFSAKKEIDLAMQLDAEENNIMPPLSDVGFIKQAIKLAERNLSKDQQQLLRKYESSLTMIVKPGGDPGLYKRLKNKRFDYLLKIFKDPNYKSLKEELMSWK